MTFAQLNDHSVTNIEEIVSELFLKRPYMPPHCAESKLSKSLDYIEVHLKSLSDYLQDYGQVEFKQIEHHLLQITQSQPELIFHYGILHDTEKTYQQLRERLTR